MRFEKRILYLCSDPALLRSQLSGEAPIPPDPNQLADNVSTDEIAPAWASYYFDDTLARYCLTGFRSGLITEGSLSSAGFSVLVAGENFGCGSSRETAPFSQLAAGFRLVVAKSFAKIYRQNCDNLGLYTSTDMGLLGRIDSGQAIELSEFCKGAGGVVEQIILSGGLFGFNKRRLSGRVAVPGASDEPRAMTVAEKILAQHAVGTDPQAAVGAVSTAPGQMLFVRADIRFTHDYVTAMADTQFRAGFGEDAQVFEPESVFLFSDHLTLVEQVMPEEHRRLGLADQVQVLREGQDAFAVRHGIRHYAERATLEHGRISEGICHHKVIEDLALPGQVVVGTDSHTCMAGVLGCLAFGVGSTDMANAFLTGDVRVSVPETMQIELVGRFEPGVCTKDLMLKLLCSESFRRQAEGRVLEVCGEGYAALPLDERATLTNMAAEAGAFTAIGAVDECVVAELSERRRLTKQEMVESIVLPDDGATYAAKLRVELGDVQAMVAEPADPSRGVVLDQLLERYGDVPIDIAYGGSCTGGKRYDMDMYASVIACALEQDLRVAKSVKFFIQFGSQAVRSHAEQRGYMDLFRRAGIVVVEPGCGACIRAGPGISTRAEQVTVSAVNRNFPGRSGPGRVYLASPLVVAASAIAGKLAGPGLFLRQPLLQGGSKGYETLSRT